MQCAVCHPGKAPPPFPAAPVYRIKDYVFFSHARHKLECGVCHGNVYEMAVVQKVRGTDMKACVDCHKERQATLVCNACHELGQ